jgi:hypothetical protein
VATSPLAIEVVSADARGGVVTIASDDTEACLELEFSADAISPHALRPGVIRRLIDAVIDNYVAFRGARAVEALAGMIALPDVSFACRG